MSGSPEEIAHANEVREVGERLSAQLTGVPLPIGIDTLLSALSFQVGYAIANIQNPLAAAEFMANVVANLMQNTMNAAQHLSQNPKQGKLS